jgi:hypothetical protein
MEVSGQIYSVSRLTFREADPFEHCIEEKVEVS